MPIFRIAGEKAKKLHAVSVDKEKGLQRLVEANLLEFLDMHFLATEYSTTAKGRIDTLAVDTNGAPAIIEYKLRSDENIINQGLSYLRWLKAQKAEFFQMLVQNKLPAEIARNLKIDWQNPRVICIAESYNKFDLDTVEILPLRVELFRYRLYEGGILSLESVTVSESEVETRRSVERQDEAAKPTVDDFAQKTSPELRETFFQLRDRILALDEKVTERCTSYYIAYRASKNFVEFIFGREAINLHLRPVDYDDPGKLVSKIPEGYGWALSRRVIIKSRGQLDYVFGLIEQSYKDVL